MQYSGDFSIVEWNENVQQELDNGRKLSLAQVVQHYAGDLSGEGKVSYYMSYSESGDAHFNGFEYFVGKIKDQECQLTFKHSGRFENGVATSDYLIIESVPDKQLIGKTGSFRSAEDCKAQYQINP